MGLKQIVKSALVNKNSTRYQAELESRLCSYHAWITGQEAGYRMVSVSEGEKDSFLLVYNPQGHLSEKASEWIADCFACNPEAVLVYGDEDVWSKGQERISPYFKPDWSPDLFEEKFYLGGLVAARKEWLATHDPELLKKWELADCGLSPKEDCHGIVAETVALVGGYQKGTGRSRILHIPRILFHNDSEAVRNDWLEYARGSIRIPSQVGDKMVSVIIPSKDNPELLEKCIGSVLADKSALKYEIIVVDNGSAPDRRKQIEAVLHHYRQVGQAGLKRILYHYDAMEFNFSKMCNLGAKKASGELLLFFNDDVTLAQEGTIGRMASLAARPMTGAVGLKLLYPVENMEEARIQHAGITNLPMGPVHKLQFCRDREVYYFGKNRGRHNVLAVTAACLMVEKSKFTQIGGFAEELAVAFNDVDLCFALYHNGYENVCECSMYAYHNESYSRGDDESSQKLARLLSERAKLYARYPELEGRDPYYSRSLNRDGLDTRIRPVYEQGKNTIQQVGSGEGSKFEVLDEAQEAQRLANCREDACLMVRVESVLQKENVWTLTGWSVVLGDNNACYDNTLLLKSESGCYCLALLGQYRPDLVENMPDQTNVGLSGFRLEWEDALPAGNYRVGVMARNRINGVSLINWSNRMVEV